MTASTTIRSAGTPDPKAMVLTSFDLPGGGVTSQGYYQNRAFPSTVSYSREVEAGREGSTVLALVDAKAEIGASSEETAVYIAAIKRVLGSKRGPAELAKLVPIRMFATRPALGRPRDLGVGPGSFDLPIRFKLLGVRTVAHLAVFRVEQVMGTVAAVGAPGQRVPLGVMARLASLMAGRMSAGLMPVNTVLPTISGNAQAGQTLTAIPGTWSGNPGTYAFQWQRCDASAASCVDIPAVCVPGGSLCASPPVVTGQRYLVTWRDSVNRSTIRVTVTARNALGTAAVVSGATPSAIDAPRSQWPSSTSGPTISGELRGGGTLTATTGGWTANPTSFAVVWQRCDSSSCVPVGSGVGSLEYVVGSSDVGFALRVCVIAYNAAGAGSACSGRSAEIT